MANSTTYPLNCSSQGGLRGAGRYRCVAPAGDAERTAPVSGKDVLYPFDGGVVTQDGAKEQQLATAQLRTKLRGLRDGTMILDKLERSIAPMFRLGHKSFFAPNLGKSGHPILEHRIRTWHPGTVALDLLPSPLLGQTFEALLTEDVLDGLEHPNRELRVAIGEAAVRVGRKPPEAGRTAHLAPLVREIDEFLSLQHGEVLAHSHRGDAQPLGHSRHGLRSLGLQDKKYAFPPGAGMFRVHPRSIHGHHYFDKIKKYMLDK